MPSGWRPEVELFTHWNPTLPAAVIDDGRVGGDGEDGRIGGRKRRSDDDDDDEVVGGKRRCDDDDNKDKDVVESGKQDDHEKAMLNAEICYKDECVEYYQQKQLTVDDSTEAKMDVDEADGEGTAPSPTLCEQFISQGSYSPRQVQAFCRPMHGGGDVCLLFPYHSDCY